MATPIEQFVPEFGRRVKKLQEDVVKSPSQIAEWGARRAKSIAPKDTGSLINAISWKSIPGQKESKALIFVRSATNTKHRGRYARVPRYAAIHHNLGLGSKYQAKTGDPHWAFTVAREGKKKFGSTISTHIQKFIGR